MRKYELPDMYRLGLSVDALRAITRQGYEFYGWNGLEKDVSETCPYKDDLRAHYWWEGFHKASDGFELHQIYRDLGID